MKIRYRSAADAPEDLKRPEGYVVLALEVTSEALSSMFWVVGDAFNQRLTAGIIRPDLVPSDASEIIDESIPNDWRTVAHRYGDQWRVITSSAGLTGRGFLEGLLEGDEEAAKEFLDALAASGLR